MDYHFRCNTVRGNKKWRGEKLIWWIYVVVINTHWYAYYIIVSFGVGLEETKYNHLPKPGYHLLELLFSFIGITAPTHVSQKIGDPIASGIGIVETMKERDAATATQRSQFLTCSTVAKSASNSCGTPQACIVRMRVVRRIWKDIGDFTTLPSSRIIMILKNFINPHIIIFIRVTKIKVKGYRIYPIKKGVIDPDS